jgi:hypothetical protein
MGTQYRISAAKVKRYSSAGLIQAEVFNAEGYSRTGYTNVSGGLGMAQLGDAIIEVVGVVKERPKMEKRILPFVVGDRRASTNGNWWKLVGILSDRLVWANDNDSGPSLFTLPDGKPWKDGYTSFSPKVEEVQVGVEKYIDKDIR